MNAQREPYDTWQRGGSTHWSECWKGHLICALVRAVDMLDATMDELCEAGVYEMDGNSPREDFIEYVRANR